MSSFCHHFFCESYFDLLKKPFLFNAGSAERQQGRGAFSRWTQASACPPVRRVNAAQGNLLGAPCRTATDDPLGCTSSEAHVHS